MASVRIRLFVSHPVAKAQYDHLLSSQSDFYFVSEKEKFQVGVIDGELTSLDTWLALARLRFPEMRPLLLWFSSDENECLRWLLRGVWGLVNYDHYENDLPRAVRQLAEGQLWFPASVVVRWMRMDEARRASALGLALTQREREVMELLFRRLSNKEIASILRIKESTTKFHVSNVFNKLQVSSRQELTTEVALRLGFA